MKELPVTTVLSFMQSEICVNAADASALAISGSAFSPVLQSIIDAASAASSPALGNVDLNATPVAGVITNQNRVPPNLGLQQLITPTATPSNQPVTKQPSQLVNRLNPGQAENGHAASGQDVTFTTTAPVTLPFVSTVAKPVSLAQATDAAAAESPAPTYTMPAQRR